MVEQTCTKSMNANMIKRKRLDARSFRDWHMSNIKKRKGCSPSAPEQGNMISMERNDKLEASGSTKPNNDTVNFHSHEQREDPDLKSPPANREVTPEQDGCIVPNGLAEPLSSKDKNNERIPIETTEAEVPADNPDKPSSESGSDSKHKEDIEGETKFEGRQEEVTSSPRFIEYWVPVGFSYLQLEKYCEMLTKNWMLLCSKTKRVINLQDILVRGRECCDHPYLLDSSLERSVNEKRPVVDFLTNGIEASGKLLLLDKFLHEVKGKGQRVVIMFQSPYTKSGVVQLRHLLDDTIRQRFGEESYVHIYRDYDRSMKRAVCDLFNDKKSGTFVMLMEKCASTSSIKLSSVDFVILFNSDWSPINDLKFLQKMSIQSTGDHLKVLRLYSSNTLEEKVLTLAKEGSPLESNVTNFSYNIYHMLLLWGASYLFNKLDNFHGSCTSGANLKHLTEDKLILDVFDELLMISSCQNGEEHNFSLISKVPEGQCGYPASISIHGEQDSPTIDGDIPPCVIWCSLLEKRNPEWRLLPKSSNEIRGRRESVTRPHYYDEGGFEIDVSTSKKTSPSQAELQHLQRTKSKKVTRLAAERTSGNITCCPTSDGAEKEMSPSRDESDDCDVASHIEETCKRRMRDLLLKQKYDIRELYRSKREERAKLDESYQLELDRINQRCTEAGEKQEEVKRLDNIYGKKVEEHMHQMDMKRKELEDAQRASRIEEEQMKAKLISASKMEDAQRASRIEEEQMKAKLISALKMKHFEGRISELVNESCLEFDLGLADLSEKVTDANTVSDPAACSKKKLSEDIEQGFRDNHVQRDDPKTPVLHEDTEILSVESDEEDDAESLPREAESNTTENNVSPHLPLNTASCSENLINKTSLDTQSEPNSENEGNSSTNVEHRTETVQGITVENQSRSDIHGHANILPECPVSGPLESDGENEVCTSNEPQPCAPSAQNRLEQVSHITDIVVLDSDNDMDVCGGASNGQCHEQISTELPSSRAAHLSPILQPSNVGSAVDNSLPLVQPDVSARPPGYELRRISEASTGYNFVRLEMPISRQNQFPLRHSRYDAPLSHLPMQSFVGRDHTHISSAAYTTVMQSPNSYFPNVSSLSSNATLSRSTDPLEIEFNRMQREQELARKIHQDKIIYIKSACEKEVQEVRKKYDLLRQEAEVEYQQKNVALESVRTKVKSHIILADAFKNHFIMPRAPAVSPDALISAISEFPLLQQHNSSTPQNTAATSARPAATATATEVQVVHQLSDLISVQPVHLNSPSPVAPFTTAIPPTNLVPLASPPHLNAYGYRPLSPPAITSLTGRPNWIRPTNNWTRPYSLSFFSH